MIKKNNFLKIFVIFIISLNYVAELKSENFYDIKAEKLIYQDNTNKVIAEGDAVATSDNKIISAKKIIYDKKKNILETFGLSKYTDGKNTLEAKKFIYSINLKKIEAKKNVIFIDTNKNKYFFDTFVYFNEKGIGSGDNIETIFFDGSHLKSKSGKFDQKKSLTLLNNATYTTCSKVYNKENKYCPTWSLKSRSIAHDKNKKKIIHRNSTLRIKNIPILYSPFFSHPDPTVDRLSGFLPPSIKTLSNIGRTVRVPYYWAISKDKDLLFTPVFYFKENHLYNINYRQALKHGNLKLDTSYTKGYKRFKNNQNRTKGSRNYLFAEYTGQHKNIIFKNNELNFKIQRVSQKNYLRINKLSSNLFKEDIRELENSLKISSYEKNKRLDIKFGIFENLDVATNDKYTYFYPDAKFSYNTKLFNNYNINTNNFLNLQKFSDDKKKNKFLNEIQIQKKPNIIKPIGLKSILKFGGYNKNLIYNNYDNKKQNIKINNNFTIALDNTIPLAKFSEKNSQLLTPRVFLKTTSGNMQSSSNSNKILNFHDSFAMNRTNSLENIETGNSAGYGFDYLYKKNDQNKNKTQYSFGTGISQVVRDKIEKKMPNRSSLNNKTSDFAGHLKFDFFSDNENLNLTENEVKKISFLNTFKDNKISINYNYNLSNDFSKIHRNSLITSYSYNNFFNSIRFEEKNEHVGNEKNINFNLKKLFTNNLYFNIETKKNLNTDSSEFHKFGVIFENDCILASLSLSKNFYYDDDLKSSKNLIFGIVIKPFSDSIAPDLTSFID
ncbi:LPS-assembly protein LptD [Candidatus Pelagibacter sp. HIMB1517]|uniref:LPS-assembly protein LptD n=1 Tax=Candidatus Pelagibacter sp. HIMB1517 TaxID=3413341 RepID=UPI003F869A20